MIYERTTSDWNKVIGAFTVHKFLKLLSTPFNRMKAFKLGIIDSKGKYIKKVEDLTKKQEKDSVDVFNRMVIGIKKIIDTHQNPSLRAKMKALPTSMLILRDEIEKLGIDGEEVILEIQEHLYKEYGIEIDDNCESLEINNLFEEEIGD